MNIVRPLSQHRVFGWPYGVAAEHGDALRAPGGTVDVTAIDTGTVADAADGGDDGLDETAFITITRQNHDAFSLLFYISR